VFRFFASLRMTEGLRITGHRMGLPRPCSTGRTHNDILEFGEFEFWYFLGFRVWDLLMFGGACGQAIPHTHSELVEEVPTLHPPL